MARCEEGYRCAECGGDVEHLRDSDLYLRYILGELDPELLHTSPERHIRCNPVLAQFIRHADFVPAKVDGPFALDQLDAAYAKQRTELVSRAYERLLELDAAGGDRDVTSYPLPAAAEKYREG